MGSDVRCEAMPMRVRYISACALNLKGRDCPNPILACIAPLKLNAHASVPPAMIGWWCSRCHYSHALRVEFHSSMTRSKAYLQVRAEGMSFMTGRLDGSNHQSRF